MKKKVLPVLVVVVLIILIAAGLVISSLIEKYTPTEERQDLSEYFNITSEDQAAILLNNENTGLFAQIIDDHIYLDYYFVHNNINARFYWDANENILLYTTATNLISAQADSDHYTVTKSSEDFGHTIVKATAESALIDIDFVKQYSDFTYTYETDPSRIILTSEWGDITVAALKKDSQLRIKGGIKSPILADIAKGTQVTVLAPDTKWTKVITEDGIIGYVRSKLLSSASTITLTSDFEEETFTHILKNEDICMAWHQVTSKAANSDISSVLANTKGINVISPTWFYLNDNKGGIADLGSSDYVTYCHQQGVEVWALVSNLENADVDTSYVLSHTSTRQYLVNQLISAAIQYDLDGINLDFEALSSKGVGDSFIQFVREISLKCANNGLVLSVDNYVPSDYTAFYNRTEQANFADYIIIMGYDEHTSSSEEEGSVASLPWVKDAVANTLLEVPAEQVILGMPFYTRVWRLTPNSSVSAEDEEYYTTYTLSSKAYGMTAAANLVKDYNAESVWMEDCGQYYVEFNEGETIVRIWMEDASSLEQRLKVMDENALAGAAFWKLGFETSEIWDTVIKYMN